MSQQTASQQIHPTAVVDPKAELASGVVIGPGAVVGPEVVIGENTWIGPHAVLDGRLTLGRDNKVYPGACLGLPPQDLKYRGANTEVLIGDGNTLRECVTINRATEEGEVTHIGNGNLLMAYCHLGHNCDLGNNIVMSNAIQVRGHVVIEDRAVVGGCLGILPVRSHRWDGDGGRDDPRRPGCSPLLPGGRPSGPRAGVEPGGSAAQWVGCQP